MSKRSVEEIADTVFDAPISLGAVVNLEREVSKATATKIAAVLKRARFILGL